MRADQYECGAFRRKGVGPRSYEERPVRGQYTVKDTHPCAKKRTVRDGGIRLGRSRCRKSDLEKGKGVGGLLGDVSARPPFVIRGREIRGSEISASGDA